MTTVTDFRNNTLMLVNELVLANKNATLDTWPTLRDAVLDRFDLKEELSHLEYDPTL